MKNTALLVCLMMTAPALSWARAETSFSVRDWAQQNPSKLKQPNTWSLLEKKLLSSRSPEAQTLQKARELFAEEKFPQALSLYDQIPKGSDHWLEAIEEKAWIFHRQKDYDKTLAQTKTLLSQAFAPIVGPEPFFLQSLSQLKICDYKSIFETHELFKSSQRQRIQDLKDLEKTGDGPAVRLLIEKADQFPLRFADLGEAAKSLPRQFHRDINLQKSLLRLKLAQVAGLPAKQAEAAKALHQRLQTLAKVENEENFKMVQKLNLIEVETIQRVHADQQLSQDTYQKGKFADLKTDQLEFPDDGHPWIDEVDKYQVRVNSCPQDIRRKM